MKLEQIVGIILFALCISFSGCASAYKGLSAGQIGCMEDDIEISHLSQGVYNETWLASCGSRKFICSRTGASGSFQKQISCREALHVVKK